MWNHHGNKAVCRPNWWRGMRASVYSETCRHTISCPRPPYDPYCQLFCPSKTANLNEITPVCGRANYITNNKMFFIIIIIIKSLSFRFFNRCQQVSQLVFYYSCSSHNHIRTQRSCHGCFTAICKTALRELSMMYPSVLVLTRWVFHIPHPV